MSFYGPLAPPPLSTSPTFCAWMGVEMSVKENEKVYTFRK